MNYSLEGLRFNKLLVLGQAGSQKGKIIWNCTCDCGNQALVTTFHLRSGRVKTCGCGKGNHKRTAEELKALLLLRRKVINDCWLWTGRKNGDGYGMVSTRLFGKTAVLVHRLSAHFWLGMSSGDNRLVCHHCDNPSCFNPKHLFLGTQSENIKDCINKNRGRWNTRPPVSP